MATKKAFTQDLGKLLGNKSEKVQKTENAKKRIGEQTENDEQNTESLKTEHSVRKPLRARRMFTSLSLDVELYEKIREIARVNKLQYNEILDSAMRKYIELYEVKNGPVEIVRESNISADSLI